MMWGALRDTVTGARKAAHKKQGLLSNFCGISERFIEPCIIVKEPGLLPNSTRRLTQLTCLDSIPPV